MTITMADYKNLSEIAVHKKKDCGPNYFSLRNIFFFILLCLITGNIFFLEQCLCTVFLYFKTVVAAIHSSMDIAFISEFILVYNYYSAGCGREVFSIMMWNKVKYLFNSYFLSL